MVLQQSDLVGYENPPSSVRVKVTERGNKIQKREVFGRWKDTNRRNIASTLRRNSRKLIMMQ